MFSPEGLYYRDSTEIFFQYICISTKCLKTETSSANLILSQSNCTGFGSSASSQLQSDPNSLTRSVAVATEGEHGQ